MLLRKVILRNNKIIIFKRDLHSDNFHIAVYKILLGRFNFTEFDTTE